MPEPQPFYKPRTAPSRLLLMVLRFGALLFGMTAIARGLTLEWDPNPEGDIAGYVVYYGTDTSNFSNTADVGNTTSYPLTDLSPSTTYYFSVQAYNTAGKYSGLCEPILYTTDRADSGLVMSASGESVTDHGGKIQLGAVNLGATSESNSLTLTNTGSVTLTNITFSITGAAAGDFRIVGHSVEDPLISPSLKPGESITFGFVFRPRAPGYREAVFRVIESQSDFALFETTLSANGSYPFDSWLSIKAVTGGANGNPDGDALNNLFEYAFGTNPKADQATTIIVEPSGTIASRGSPSVKVITTPKFEFHGLFARRKDHANVGLIYRTQFSADLNIWQDSSSPHLVEGDDGEIEAVSVKAPPSINGQLPRFFRVAVIQKGRLSLPEWLVAQGADGGANDNSDGDGLNNLFEFAFGTNPKVAQANVASELDGLVASRGAPTIRIPTKDDFWFRGLFCRRRDRDFHKLIYKPQFSHDLRTWVESPYRVVVLADDGEIEVVSARSPDTINGMQPRFFRVEVTIAP